MTTTLKTLLEKINEDYIILSVGVLLAILLRGSPLNIQSDDYINFTRSWINFIEENGGFSALEHSFSNYTPPYLYLLVISSLVFSGMSTIFKIKIVSIVFDFFLAYFVYKIVALKYSNPLIPRAAFLVILFVPTVFLNSAFWGQVDVIYTTGLVAFVYFYLTHREIPAFIAYGLAISFKLQALFLFPLLIILFLYQKVSWKSFFIIPATYVLTVIPAWLMGRPMDDLLTIYLNQADYYRNLTMGAPNLYQWLPNNPYYTLVRTGLIGTVIVVFLFCALVYKGRLQLTKGMVIELATISVLIMPYFLPKMHDRYFYAADVFSVLLAFYYPHLFFVPVLIQGVSFFSYLPFLFDVQMILPEYLALVLLIIISFLLYRVVRAIIIENTPQSRHKAVDSSTYQSDIKIELG